MPPASASAGLPAPFAPWQAMHFCSYTCRPWRALPPPFGNPAPLGGMLMSKRAISSALTAAPNAGGLPGAGCRLAQAASAAAAITTMRLDVNIFHASVCPHRPAHDGVVVIVVGG